MTTREPRYVFDTNTLVSAALFEGSTPDRAFRWALRNGGVYGIHHGPQWKTMSATLLLFACDTMRLATLPGSFGICKLEPDAALPAWLPEGAFYSVTRTAEELSVVSLASAIPDTVACERNWRCFRVQGPLDFSLTGVLASLAVLLAEAEISIFAVSTYDTDYLLVHEAQFAQAQRVLTEAGHQVDDPEDGGDVA